MTSIRTSHRNQANETEIKKKDDGKSVGEMRTIVSKFSIQHASTVMVECDVACIIYNERVKLTSDNQFIELKRDSRCVRFGKYQNIYVKHGHNNYYYIDSTY